MNDLDRTTAAIEALLEAASPRASQSRQTERESPTKPTNPPHVRRLMARMYEAERNGDRLALVELFTDEVRWMRATGDLTTAEYVAVAGVYDTLFHRFSNRRTQTLAERRRERLALDDFARGFRANLARARRAPASVEGSVR